MLSTVLLTRSIRRLRSALVKPSLRMTRETLDRARGPAPSGSLAMHPSAASCCRSAGQLLRQLHRLSCSACCSSSIRPVMSFRRFVQHFFGDLLLVEEYDFFDRAHAALQVFADGDDFADHDRRTRHRLEHAQLATLDALGDFNFAFAGKQRNGAHLAQVHADGIVGFFQRARREVEFNVFAGFPSSSSNF